MGAVFQVHNEFKTAGDGEVQCRTFQAGLGDRPWRAVFARISPQQASIIC
jgi:hypothetical protein